MTGELAAAAVAQLVDIIRTRGDDRTNEVLNLVRAALAGDPSLPQLENETAAGRPQQATADRVTAALQQRIDSDQGYAGLLKQAMDRSEYTVAGGPSKARQDSRVSISRSDHSRIKNVGNNKVRNTNVAVGGGALLAIAIVVVATLYFRTQSGDKSTAAYQAQVAVACSRIAAGQHQLPVDPSTGKIRRSGLLDFARDRPAEIRDQVDPVLEMRTPAGLAQDRQALSDAAQRIYAAVPGYLAAVARLPALISLDQLTTFSSAPVSKQIALDYSQLGDSLARLSGKPCNVAASS